MQTHHTAHKVALNSEVVDEWHFRRAVAAEDIKLLTLVRCEQVTMTTSRKQFDISSRYSFVKVPFVNHLAVERGKQNDPLGKKRVPSRSLMLAVSTSAAANGVDLVDENDCRRVLLRLLEPPFS